MRGLAELLASLNLTDHLAAALSWCEAEGANDVADLAEYADELADHLKLVRIRRKNFIKALAPDHAPGPTPGPAPPAPSPTFESCSALVVGVGSYSHCPLDNPPHDAADMHAKLLGMGFASTLVVDCGLDDFVGALHAWYGSIKQGGAALFFFAGHGCEYQNDNYLIPAGDIPKDDWRLETKAINVREVRGQMLEQRGASLSVLLLDCCREFKGMSGSTRSTKRGLGRMEPLKGSVVGFACAANEVADDGGGGRNGVYTKHLLEHIATPGLDVRFMLGSVSTAVEKATNGKQRPHDENSGLPGNEVYLC